MPDESATATTRSIDSDAWRPGWLALVATLSLAVYLLTLEAQIYDTNFYSLWEAAAILAGDHPYRDFFEWGMPLHVALTTVLQWLVGYRLIGEFLFDGVVIAAGAALSFHLAFRLSRSIAASLLTMMVALTLQAATAPFHYPKLALYPLTIWLAWRYLEGPTTRRGIALGATVAAAFLFRHDHGVYTGVAAVLAFGLARVAWPASRDWRASTTQALAFVATVLVILTPWLLFVQASEGLPEYVESRGQLYTEWSARDSPYRLLLEMNPVRTLTPDAPPPARSAAVSLEWKPLVDDAQRTALERRHGLRFVDGPDATGRWSYDVPNVFDLGLLELYPFVTNTAGFGWDRLEELHSPLPTRGKALRWIQQTVLLVPLLMLTTAFLRARRHWLRAEPVALDVYRVVLAGAFLALVDSRMLREASYVVAVAPLTAAMAAWVLSSGEGVGAGRVAHGVPAAWRALWPWLRRGIVAVVLVVTGISTFVHVRESGIFEPLALADTVGPAIEQLVASPPIDGYLSPRRLAEASRAQWESGNLDRETILLRYLHDCTAAGDRVLVTGSTPYQVGYYAERPIAGGQLFWHHGWRADPERQRTSLDLLEHQSVPFAFSTHDPVLDDFKAYPTIRAHLMTHYVELAGSSGRLLIDARRTPTGQFANLGFPCFR